MGAWDTQERGDDARLERALGYPYHLPTASYVFTGSGHTPCTPSSAEPLRIHRTPVLAVGSNQSPEQLARKYQGDRWAPILCERCSLLDFDTVYSAHITAYGSIAAALHPSPGTRVSLFVNWLDERQLDIMHETEIRGGNYAFARLHDIDLETDLGHACDSVYFYVGLRGALSHDGGPVPLSAVDASGRRWQSHSQHAVQERVRDRVAPGEKIARFILASIDDAALRTSRRQSLAADALPFEYSGMTVIPTP